MRRAATSPAEFPKRRRSWALEYLLTWGIVATTPDLHTKARNGTPDLHTQVPTGHVPLRRMRGEKWKQQEGPEKEREESK
jgi:hypothetical protein